MPEETEGLELGVASLQARADPEWFFRDLLGEDPWEKQVEIALSIRDNRRTSVPSCHSAGKDWTSARLVLWFLFAFIPSKVLTTAPTDRQVRHILWAEIAGAHPKIGVGDLFTQRIDIAPDWFALGFTASDYEGSSSRFQGFHAPHVLCVLDEAAGISREIYDGVDGIMSSGFCRSLEIGNPTDPTCEFAKRSRLGTVHKVPISAFDTPNFTETGITREDIDSGEWEDKVQAAGGLPRPYLCSPEWVAEQVSRWGWEDPFTISRVLGRFPSVGSDALLKDDWIDDAQERSLHPEGRRILSCDVARFGDDETVIGFRSGPRYRRIDGHRGKDLMATANKLKALRREYEAEEIRVDDDGLGGGVSDRLAEQGEPVRRMVNGAAAQLPDRYRNARAEWHWQTRMRFERGEIDIDPRDEDLSDQLRQLKLGRYGPEGQIGMEPKEDFKKRVGRSPDDSDTLVMACAELPPIGEGEEVQVF